MKYSLLLRILVFLSILKFGLKHGLATRPNESNILSYAKDIWEQMGTN